MEVSDSQKQSINDASQYVAVLTHLPEGVGMNVANLQIIPEILARSPENYTLFIEKSTGCAKVVKRNESSKLLMLFLYHKSKSIDFLAKLFGDIVQVYAVCATDVTLAGIIRPRA